MKFGVNLPQYEDFGDARVLAQLAAPDALPPGRPLGWRLPWRVGPAANAWRLK